MLMFHCFSKQNPFAGTESVVAEGVDRSYSGRAVVAVRLHEIHRGRVCGVPLGDRRKSLQVTIRYRGVGRQIQRARQMFFCRCRCEKIESKCFVVCYMHRLLRETSAALLSDDAQYAQIIGKSKRVTGVFTIY